MFNKIIKRGHRKGSKADDSAFGYAQSGNRGSGVVSTSNVVVNHASRVGPPGAGGPNSAPPPDALKSIREKEIKRQTIVGACRFYSVRFGESP
ncbi:hypothetical protein Ancab_039394 [Ancistrocladus abbreviatus]